jgi:hypothetical protein
VGDAQGPWTHLIMTAITLAGVAVIMWMEAPEWQRQMAARKIRLRLRSAATRLAACAGHRAMGRELGGTPENDAGYHTAYRISRFRDTL